jgi:3-oxoacyl-[acyl-carrier protein] reductase
VKDIHALGSSAKAFQGDLSSVAGIRTVFSQIKDAFPQGLDVVVLNAGVGAKLNLDEADEKSYDKVFDTNTKGAFFSAQESAKQLKDGGKLLFISTAATHAILPGGTIYTASKAAVDQFARLLAVELGARKISVNSIAPAYTETDMFPPELREFALATTPFKRVGQVEDIAEAVYGIIVSPWITGAVIPVTGGAVIY